MKKIKYFMFATAALLFAACSSDDAIVEKQSPQTAADNNAVEFSAYVNRSTRAGWAGELTTAQLQGAADGFGVFGYYTNGELYNETAKPDFMYNQHVTYSGGMWTYSPIKYWPNEFGNNAQSEEIDRLTFFAYAPYTAVTPTTGVVTDEDHATTGIVGMSRNTSSGNPLIKYYSDLTPKNGVDLCWGVAKANFNSTVDGTNNSVSENQPYIDVIKPKIGDKIDFDFKHALAQLNVQIDADIDVESHASSSLDTYTRIYVRSITFEGFTTKGALDLNSDYDNSTTTPNWFDVSGSSKLSLEPITVYDGRRDGKEGVPTANAKNETPNDLNPDIIQSGAYTTTPVPNNGVYETLTSETPGVTNTAVNLFNSDNLTAPVLVIPTGEAMKVTIVYDVETADASLSGYLSDGATRGSTIENAITQPISMELASGKKYTVKLHLGMTSVKFEASVTDWDTGTDADVDLPYNTPGVGAGTTNSLTVSASTTTGSFDISGLTAGNLMHTSGGSGVNNTKVNGSYYIGTGITIPSTGCATIGYTLAGENTSVSNKYYTIWANERKSAGDLVTATTANITQLAKPFVGAISYAGGDNQFIITAGSGSGTVTTAEWAAATVTVKIGDANFTEFRRIDDTNRVVIRLENAPTVTTTYTITIKVGDTNPVDLPYTITI